MSRAFVREDRDEDLPALRFALPHPDDPGYDAAAAFALLHAARQGNTPAGEAATGYRWGDPQLHPHVRRLLEKENELPEEERDARWVQLARRFLRTT
jgi:hypothetical protein